MCIYMMILYLVLLSVESDVMMEILFFRYVFIVHVFPYYYVMAGFFTSLFYFVVSFMVAVL